MHDLRRIVITGRAVPVRGNDIDTDRIIPARFLKTVVFDGLGQHAFEDDRAQLRDRGEVHPLDDPRFSGATILLAGRNFGCGSSREHAPQALARWGAGIGALVAESFAEIFFGNCTALGIPCVTADGAAVGAAMAAVEGDPSLELRLDIETRSLAFGGREIAVAIADGPRRQLLDGRWDSTAELLAARDAVLETARRIPYFSGYEE